MNRRFGMLAAAALLAGPVAGQAQGTSERDISFQRTRSATITATVKSVDLKTRMVTVVGESGKPFTFKADDRVKNLPQVKPGDLVSVDYYDSVAIWVTKPGADTGGPASGSSSAMATAKPGEKPAAAAEADLTIVATVTAIAADKKSVTLKTSDGDTQTLPVKNPENLTGVMVGDQVTIMATRALAVSVDPAKPKAKAPAKAPAKEPAKK
ncbi:MAG TPA: hypothetical protein VLU43_10600 [Anaeromyxobacteraceae bacterium]|nr:hypothetical protein [Anaeromyxobacteraceae bacterium]